MLQVPCYLQFLNRMHGDSFDTYAEFFLSESRSSEVLLPELHGTDSEEVVAADVWRVTILNQLVDRTTGNVCSVEEITESWYLTHSIFVRSLFVFLRLVL